MTSSVNRNIKERLDQYLDNPFLFNLVRHIVGGGLVENISRIVSNIPHHKVVDLACGTGDISRAVNGLYIGIDLCDSFITYANRKYGSQEKKFIVMDVTDINLPKKSFDLAMIVNGIHHFSDEEVLRIFKQASELTTHYVLVIDLIRKSNWVSRLFYALDRGAHIRSLDEQKALIEKSECLKLILEDSFESTSRIYRYSVLLSEID